MRASEREDMELAVREGRFVEVAEVNPKPSISDLYILDASQYNNQLNPPSRTFTFSTQVSTTIN
jgi:hypothetical protein